MSKLSRVMLVHPNFQWSGRRTWRLIPYNLGILNACLKKAGYDSWIFDPNCDNVSEEGVRQELRRTMPDVVGITTFSTEYLREVRQLMKIVRQELPRAVVVLGGVVPTVLTEEALEYPCIDYLVMGEGEQRLIALLGALNRGERSPSDIDGLAGSSPRFLHPLKGFIANLDAVPFPDYGGLEVNRYLRHAHKLAPGILPRQFPFAITTTSRGCPYQCVFCAAATISGKKVRLRSAGNVLEEIRRYVVEYGVREMIFMDDHFLALRTRAVELMRGMQALSPGLTWKCANMAAWSLNEDTLRLMKDTGCYQMTVSIESGNASVLKTIVKKPVDLKKVPGLLEFARSLGIEVIANFVFGFPGETWGQIRETCSYAAALPADLVNFHIATPLPKTELMEICLKKGLLKQGGDALHGYTVGAIETGDFTPLELQVLRAFEWDRINFSSADRRATIARMAGISLDELEQWRVRTRRALGTTEGWKK